MSVAEAYAVLPCNGLDKLAGVIAREIALAMVEDAAGEIICPVLLNAIHDRYSRTLQERELVVIDGCGTRCASKLAAALDLKIARKVLVTEMAKEAGHELADSLAPSESDMQFARLCAGHVRCDGECRESAAAEVDFKPPSAYITVTHDKFQFRVPASDYFFSENDSWVSVRGNRARIGVTDFVQQKATDITYFEPAAIGLRLEQFDAAGEIESAKTMLDALSPVSGKVVAVNRELADSPELVNQDPYGRGWVAEIELEDFESDRELLLDGPAYAKVVEKKAADYA